MAFPEQKRFMIKDLAAHWQKGESYVEELLRKEKFPYIIVEGEKLGGHTVTRHLCYDRAFLIRKGGEFSRDLTTRERARLKIDDYISLSQQEFINICEPGSRDTSWLSQLPGYDPLEHGTVYIPAVSVNAFEQKHGINRAAKKQEQSPAPDASAIDPNKWYDTSQVARFLGVSQRHVQNVLIPEEKLKAKKRPYRWRVQGQEIRHYLNKSGSGF